ncbi:MAG TPA: enoyl-CoA hydratase-related protein [Dermatophilaceae bacterium]|nr:enoyl-CoA hydratase-related protein [Dermatophilaceae bacterium]
MSDTVVVDVTGPVGRVALDNPARLNAVDAPMLDALAEAVRALDARPDVRVVVLAGAGRGFCSGADLRAGGADGGKVDDSTLYAAGAAVRAIVASQTPVVAVVGGVAAGVGCSIALAADYVLAGESASFVLAFGRIGLMPDGGATALVAAAVGRARALRMALSTEAVGGVDAAAWGLVAECVPDDRLQSRAEELCGFLAALAPGATAATLTAVNAAALDLDSALAREEEGQSALLRTADAREGVAAFTEKRRPHFGGA